LGPLVWILIFMQRHLVDFFGNSSGKTKQFIMFEIKFVSHFNCCYVKMFYKKVSILVAVTVSRAYRTFLERKSLKVLYVALVIALGISLILSQIVSQYGSNLRSRSYL